MKRFILSALLATTALLPLLAAAGNASAREVYHREIDQQGRIYQGVKNGTVTPSEYRKLEHREAVLNNARQRDLRRSDGRLTPQEYRRLNTRENYLSRSIYQDKHN